MAQVTGPGPEVMSASTLIGDQVVNPRGEEVGKIEEIMIDMDSGSISYAVLSFGGFLGIGDRLFAIPWRLLHLDLENKRFICNVDKEKLKQAPGFDKSNWPKMGNRMWGEEIHRYYGETPYWEKEAGGFLGREEPRH